MPQEGNVTDPTPEPQPEAPQEGEPKADTLDDLPDELSWVRDEVKKARGEAAKYRTQLREVEPLAKRAQELEDAQKSDQQRLSEQLDTARSEGSTAKAEAARLRVAIEKGVPAALVDRLRGDTAEDLAADADALLELVGSNQPAPRVPSRPVERLRPGSGEPEPPVAPDMNAEIRRALGR